MCHTTCHWICTQTHTQKKEKFPQHFAWNFGNFFQRTHNVRHSHALSKWRDKSPLKWNGHMYTLCTKNTETNQTRTVSEIRFTKPKTTTKKWIWRCLVHAKVRVKKFCSLRNNQLWASNLKTKATRKISIAINLVQNYLCLH